MLINFECFIVLCRESAIYSNNQKQILPFPLKLKCNFAVNRTTPLKIKRKDQLANQLETKPYDAIQNALSVH